VCPTGASYKRAEDGIVLVDEELCIGCGLCAWACPYGARELDVVGGVMKKCTLCIDRIYNDNLPVEEREPACVAACPVHARHFGDLGDPDSAVSRLVAEREGSTSCRRWATSPPTSTCRRARAATSQAAGRARTRDRQPRRRLPRLARRALSRL
jgi:sulfite dehydrogenase (quinone) subunit SoeB